MYFRTPLSLRLVEKMPLARDMIVSYETIRLSTLSFGPEYARRLRHTTQSSGAVWHLDAHPEQSVVVGPKRHGRPGRARILIQETHFLEHSFSQLPPSVPTVLALAQPGWHDERTLHMQETTMLLRSNGSGFIYTSGNFRIAC
jgi:hypothetical protein